MKSSSAAENDCGVSRWQEMTLRDAGVSLIDCDHRTPPPADTGYPYIAIPQLKQGHLDLSDVRRITREHYEEWTRKAKPQHHDVILSRRCNPGETAVVPKGLECALGQNLVLLRADGAKLFPPFLRWLARGNEWWEQVGTFINVGAVFESLRCADIPKFSFSVPPLPEQRAIASVLGALDDKIELNRRMNETLEALAQTLFKSWFVAATQSALPKGWRVSTLGEHIEVRRGNTYKSALKDLPGPYLLGLASIQRDGGFRRGSLSTYGGESSPNILLRPGDLYVSLKDVTQSADLLGAVARVPPDIELGRLTQDTVKLLFKNTELSTSYVYRALRTPEYREYCRAHATGTTNLGLSRDDFLSYEVVIAPDNVQRKFDELAGSLERRFDLNDAESRTLAALRDALLPKLLSGELRVPTAAKLTEATA